MLFKKKNNFENSRQHLANERTFLAWVRTSVTLMGFGFVIVKFTLFLKEFTTIMQNKNLLHKEYSSLVGIIMIGLGVLIALLSFIQYKNKEMQLNKNKFYSSSFMMLLTSLMIIICGIILIIYLNSIIK